MSPLLCQLSYTATVPVSLLKRTGIIAEMESKCPPIAHRKLAHPKRRVSRTERSSYSYLVSDFTTDRSFLPKLLKHILDI